MCLEFTSTGLVRAVRSATPTKLIDGRVPESAVKPRNHAVVSGRPLGPRDDLRESVLQDVLGQSAISDAALQVAHKGQVIGQQRFNRRAMFYRVHVIAPM